MGLANTNGKHPSHQILIFQQSDGYFYRIKIIYWLATIVVVILGLACFAMEDYGPVLGVLVLIFGPIAVRVYAEMSIVLFKISESLVSIRDNQNK